MINNVLKIYTKTDPDINRHSIFRSQHHQALQFVDILGHLVISIIILLLIKDKDFLNEQNHSNDICPNFYLQRIENHMQKSPSTDISINRYNQKDMLNSASKGSKTIEYTDTVNSIDGRKIQEE